MVKYQFVQGTVKQTISCVILYTLATQTFAVNPGIKLKVTKAGIEYANRFAESTVGALLQSFSLTDQSGQAGHFTWELKNIQKLAITGPKSHLTFNPEHNGLTWTLSKLGANLAAEWRIRYKQGWFKINDGGKMAVNVSDISMTTTVVFGQTNGRPSISSKSCSVDIGDININFRGATAFIWNLLKGVVDSKAQGLLQSQICALVNKMINEDAADALSNVKVELEMADQFIMDYSLVTAPVISQDYLEILHKGQFYWKADKQSSPLLPNAIPEWSNGTSMLNLALTQYTANTFTHVAHHHGYLVYAFTRDNLREEDIGYLNTTCSSHCIGSVISEISRLYPNSWVEVRVNSSTVPQLSISTQNITVDARANLDLFVHSHDGNTTYLLTLNGSLSLTGQASIRDDRLVGNITSYRFDVSVLNSNIGPVHAQDMKAAFNVLLNGEVIPKLNKIAQSGVTLPLEGYVKFLNAKLVHLDGVLFVSTDVQYENSPDIAI